MIPASAPIRVLTRLREAADGPVRVLHRGPRAIYLELGGRCLGVVDAGAAQVPCALRIRDVDLATLASREGQVWVRRGLLTFGDVPVLPGRIVDVRVPLLDRDALAPVVADPIVADNVAGMVGAGDGLTPYADDVLCGWLALHRAAGVPTPEVDAAVRDHLHRTTLFSATLLDCALDGEVLPQFAAYVAALGTDDELEAAAFLASVGHSSGRGLLEGARRAQAQLTAAVRA
jgi:hypothetical protein